MPRLIRILQLILTASLCACAHHENLPPAPREFRAVWVATVVNIDWPSKPGLSNDEQQREIRAIIDRASELNLNAIILQVRTSCDALYPSNLEPWSDYLTGRQGQPPQPFYDPLKMWIDLAHARGIELHAWFNPFRARVNPDKTQESPDHISKTHPELVKRYGDYLWLDPGEPQALDHTINVFMDVVRRYDIDGVHIDDYFYPYPLPKLDFPDEPSWQRYVSSGGKLSRADWRRQNINTAIERIYREIKLEKKHVKFGISPFGIWKPGHPSMVRGFNQYESLYADAKLWLNEGWCDYFTPQLYWRIAATSQPYPNLLDWWIGENLRGRHIWPGNIPSRIGDGRANWDAQEIISQISITRARPGSTGNVHFSMKPLMQNRGGIADALRAGPYAQPALVPASPWLDNRPPRSPDLAITSASTEPLSISWKPRGAEPAFRWVLYTHHAGQWKLLTILLGPQLQYLIPEDPSLGRPGAVALCAVDRTGNQSPPTICQRR